MEENDTTLIWDGLKEEVFQVHDKLECLFQDLTLEEPETPETPESTLDDIKTALRLATYFKVLTNVVVVPTNIEVCISITQQILKIFHDAKEDFTDDLFEQLKALILDLQDKILVSGDDLADLAIAMESDPALEEDAHWAVDLFF